MASPTPGLVPALFTLWAPKLDQIGGFFCCHITPCQYHAATMLVRCQVHVVTLEQVIDISLFHVITTLLSFISTISSPPTCHVIAIWPLRPYHVITISLPYHSDLLTMSSPCHYIPGHYHVITTSFPCHDHVP